MNYRVKEKIAVADLSFRVQNVIKTEIDVTMAQLSRNGIDVLSGIARFLDPHHLVIENSRGQSEYEADIMVIATGTRPAESPQVPLNGRTILNSDQIFCMPFIPKTRIVVGGGVIGVEYTSMFATLRGRLLLIQKRARLLVFADAQMRDA